MAQRTVIELFDDLSDAPTPADETVHFGLDGQAYVIDLTGDHADELRDALHRFVAAARKERKEGPSAKASAARKPGKQGTNKQHTRAVREWARSAGYELSDRGRIPTAVLEKFEAAHTVSAASPAVPLLIEPTFAGSIAD